ncbi:DUF1015 domain-containing protein [Eubacteriales bacterium OttesenSCG-928-M02]|nr:DUF1015 domain-containing protein [Eubacteriales bacterium OttesenSCG-928-M02]
MDMEQSFLQLGMAPFRALLPRDRQSLLKWCIIACDQYTADGTYWQQVEDAVGDAPSTLRMVLPEYYLDTPEEEARIASLTQTMESYLAGDVFAELPPGFLLVERTFSTGQTRQGLLTALDLECYDYHEGATSPIRATEGTIEARIPPRLRVREHAAVELPHIMVLVDDRQHSIIRPLLENRAAYQKVYDSPLGFDMGAIAGWHIPLEGAGNLLAAMESYREGLSGDDPIVFAMGDGNHSLATAKAHWENVKRNLSLGEQASHPARFALVELVNLYDPGLTFHAVHRVVFTKDIHTACDEMFTGIQNAGYAIGVVPADDAIAASYMDGTLWELKRADANTVLCRAHGQTGLMHLPVGQGVPTAITAIDKGIAAYLENHPDATVDYIHGEKEALALTEGGKAMAFLVPPMEKEALFPYVHKYGPLPRKTFSMGEAQEKRCYLEARRIR